MRGVNSGNVLCKRLNGRVSCADSTYIRGPFFAVYRRSDSGASNALDSNKIKEQESLRFVLDVTLRNSYSASHGVTWVSTATDVQKCTKTTGFMAIQTKRTYPACESL